MSKSSIIDSHCHLDFESFDDDRMQVLQRAADNNISDIVIPGTEKSHWPRITKLCKQYKQLHACYGLHPYWVNQHKKQDIEDLSRYIENNTAVAIGECGLDFRPQQADKKKQLLFFEAQLNIAENHQLPLVIHSVNATETVIQCLKKFKNLRGMIHSFSGSAEQARQLIKLNFFISVSASVTYERAKKIRRVIRDIPLTSLLVETDAPDQPDQENYNKRNEPAFIVNTITAIARERQETFEDIARQSTINARKLFNI